MKYFNPKEIISNKELNGPHKDFFQSICNDLTDSIPEDIAHRILSEVENPDYEIFIHRTAYLPREVAFKSGLEIHVGTDLEYTASKCESKFITMINLNGAAGYKNPTLADSRVLVLKIPKSALEYVPGKSKPILFKTDNVAEQSGGFVIIKNKYQTVLPPEFILGSIEYKNGKMTEFVENPDYTDEHNFKNDGMICTDSLSWDFIHKTNQQFDDSISFEIKEEMASNMISLINEDYELNPEKYENEQTKLNTKPVTRNAESIKRYAFNGLSLDKLRNLVGKIKKAFKSENNKDFDEGNR